MSYLKIRKREGHEYVDHPNTVGVLPLDAEGFLLVEQWRAGVDGPILEIVAGKIDPGETPFEAAKREAREEIGLVDGIWLEGQTFYLTPGYSSEQMTIFYVREYSFQDADPQDGERITPVHLSYFEQPILQDAKTILALVTAS